MSYNSSCVYRDHYEVSIMPCLTDDVTEVDFFDELKSFDERYIVLGGFVI